MSALDLQELSYVATALQEILNNDKAVREGGEEKLKQIKSGDPNKYAKYLVVALQHADIAVDAKSLAAVILRRNISYSATDSQDVNNPTNNLNLWQRLDTESKEFIKVELIKTVTSCGEKQLIHKICNLIIEVGGSLYEQEEFVWQDMLNLIFQFVNSDDVVKIDAALQIFNGLFSYMLEYLVKFKKDLLEIFGKTLQHPSLDVNLSSLQAVSNYLQIAEEKDTKDFVQLLPAMTALVLKAVQADDETVLEDALVEFNEIAEIEPRFFKKHFKDVFAQLSPIVGKNDFTNASIRHQPVEFFVTIAERVPSVVKKDQDTLMALLDLIFKLMIDIDEDIEESWLKPKEGFKAEEEEEEEDSVHFGKTCVDRIVSSVGENIILPLLSTLVQNTLANTTDWRYKNAGLMAFSQVGEYIDEISKISPMIPVVIQHLQHPTPKIRYAALHCLGQIADDMSEEFQENFHEMVLPALIAMLDDPVPRVQAHACAALTNFLEGTSESIAAQYIQAMMPKLCNLISVGISIIKENAVTALASLAEAAKEHFEPYFEQCLQFLCSFLKQFNEPCYKQFKGQVIESITIISASVGLEKFRNHAPTVVAAMLEIQTQQLESKDPQRTYLLSAWQRICLLMKKEFAQFLPMVIPSLFQMATLNPEMSIQGFANGGDLVDVLSEVNPHAVPTDKTTGINITTDEIEEKDVAIQMLAVFIDELGGGFANYVESTTKILLSMLAYEANDSIRNSVAGALPGLIKCMKEAHPGNQDILINLGRTFMDKLWSAMKTETETDTLTYQVQAMKDIIDEIGTGFMTQEIVDTLVTQIIEMYKKSDERIAENNLMAKKGGEEQEEDADEEEFEDDQEMIKEENRSEYDLQLSISEIIGTIFKTHNDKVSNLLNVLFATVLPEALQSEVKDKTKFVLFILDDMVEFLGPQILGQHYMTVSEQIIKFCSNPDSAIRQAASYGIGMLAQHGGQAFSQISNNCLGGLKSAIEYQMSANIKGKKQKEKKFNYAKDNAVSALGKIIRYQTATVDYQSLIPNWMSLLPLKGDVEESQIQNEILAQILTEQPLLVVGEQYQRFETLIIILGEVLNKKYVKEETGVKFAQFLKNAANDATFSGPFKTIFDNKLSAESKQRIQDALNFQG